jgi:23S rRNA pseudouridine1911/1915/1917 synthase
MELQRLTLLEWLSARYPAAKRQTLRRMIQAGRVRVNGRRARAASDPIAPQDAVVVSDQAPPRRPLAAEGVGLVIVHEDDDVLVVNKPAGLLTSTTPSEKRPTLIALVRRHLAGQSMAHRAGVIHRLDRDASGLLVFSKNEDAYQDLKRQFFEHAVDRVYWAVVEGKVPEPRGRIESRLDEWADGSVHTTRQSGRGQIAVTDWEMARQGRRRALLRVTLQTGRKHQIRAHLSERGMPITGDRIYNSDTGASSAPLMLIATKLVFAHPRTGQRMNFTLPLPDAMREAVDASEW